MSDEQFIRFERVSINSRERGPIWVLPSGIEVVAPCDDLPGLPEDAEIVEKVTLHLHSGTSFVVKGEADEIVAMLERPW